jgi:hypothetical protein
VTALTIQGLNQRRCSNYSLHAVHHAWYFRSAQQLKPAVLIAELENILSNVLRLISAVSSADSNISADFDRIRKKIIICLRYKYGVKPGGKNLLGGAVPSDYQTTLTNHNLCLKLS